MVILEFLENVFIKSSVERASLKAPSDFWAIMWRAPSSKSIFSEFNISISLLLMSGISILLKS